MQKSIYRPPTASTSTSGTRSQAEFAGTMAEEDCIAGVTDETTGSANQTITAGNIIAVHGNGLKVNGDEAHKGQIGVFFEASSTGKRDKAG